MAVETDSWCRTKGDVDKENMSLSCHVPGHNRKNCLTDQLHSGCPHLPSDQGVTTKGFYCGSITTVKTFWWHSWCQAWTWSLQIGPIACCCCCVSGRVLPASKTKSSPWRVVCEEEKEKRINLVLCVICFSLTDNLKWLVKDINRCLTIRKTVFEGYWQSLDY